MRRPEEFQGNKEEVVDRGLSSLFGAIRDNALVHYRTSNDPDRITEEMDLVARAFAVKRNTVDWILEDGGLEELLDFMQNRHPAPGIFLVRNAHLCFPDGPGRWQDVQTVFRMREELERSDRAYRTVVFQTGLDGKLPREVAEMTGLVAREVTDEDRLRTLSDVLARRGMSHLLIGGARETVLRACAGLTSQQTEVAISHALGKGLSRPEAVAMAIGEHRQEQELMSLRRWEMVDTSSVPELIGWGGFLTYICGDKRRGIPPVEKPIILVGPPGGGKTTAAKLIAKRMNRLCLWGNPSGWLDSLLGGTEKAFAKAMREVDELGAPCVAVIDEGEKALAAGDRQTTGGVMERSLMPVLDALEKSRKGNGVLWIIASNRLAELNPAIIDRSVYVFSVPHPPDWVRWRIWQREVDEACGGSGRVVCEGIDEEFIAILTKDMSPRGVENLAAEAVRLARSGRVIGPDFLSVVRKKVFRGLPKKADAETMGLQGIPSVYSFRLTKGASSYEGPRQLPPPKRQDKIVFSQ